MVIRYTNNFFFLETKYILGLFVTRYLFYAKMWRILTLNERVKKRYSWGLEMSSRLYIFVIVVQNRKFILLTVSVPADEVQSEEHGEGEGDIDGHPLRPDLASVVGQLRGPQEEELARDGMDCAHQQLHSNLNQIFQLIKKVTFIDLST